MFTKLKEKIFGVAKSQFPNLNQNSKVIVRDGFTLEFAFTCDGTDYFEFKDKNSMPFQRGLDALIFFEELQNGVTKDYLKNHVEVMKKCLEPKQGKSIDLKNLFVELARFEERMNYILSPEIIYKVASVAFIDEKENVLKYDHEYNKHKIESWKNSGDNFFLHQPLRKLIPFLNEFGDNSQMYLRIVEQIERIQKSAHSLILLETELNSGND
jgi:hypothetical protein